ncbi:MAG TPA: hypothetical protein VG407_17220 [Caulobacteraceae bacterium]|jgi:hypothetical protein|nr:hypothetical protein [Caulobacteraceae bacterium]
MSGEGRADKRAQGAGWGRFWQALALIFSLYNIEQAVEAMLWDTGHQTGAGYIGAEHTAFRPMAECGRGCVRVDRVDPGSPLAKAGVAAGGHIRFDRSWDPSRHIAAGERLGFTIERGARWTHREVLAVARPKVDAKASSAYVIYDLLTLSTCLFGVLILWRSGGRKTPMLLGLALTCFGLVDSRPQMWEEAPQIFLPFFAINSTDYLFIFILFATFSIAFAGEAAKLRLGALKYVIATYFVAFFAVGCWRAYSEYAVLPSFDAASGCLEIMTYPLYAASLFYMYVGWKRSGRSERRRYRLMLVAFALLVLSQMVTEFVSWGLGVQDYGADPLELVAATVAGVVAPALFAYGILRHKVFDLGFALNRTLVYGVVSAILLAAFGLIEWAVEHFVPVEGREKNALVDAAIAVGVFLTFHKVRDVVEHVIERLFFRRWQRSEAELRRFVREAPFVTQAPALTKALARALTEYAEGAEAAVYLAEGQEYVRAIGDVAGAPARLDPDLSALVSLRADPKPMELQDHASGAALIAPMVNRNEVVGLALLGPKPSGSDYRPDEIELIGWATRQVGLDLHALKVEQLEATAARQREEIAHFETRVDELRLVLGARASA